MSCVLRPSALVLPAVTLKMPEMTTPGPRRFHYLLIHLLLCTLVLSFELTSDQDVTVASVEQALAQYQRDVPQDEIEHKISKLAEETTKLKQLEEEIIAETEELFNLVNTINEMQLEDFSTLLNETLVRELRHRISKEDLEHDAVKSVDDEAIANGVSLKDLDNALDPAEILKETEAEMESFLSSLSREEVMRQKTAILAEPRSKCVEPVEAVDMVQQSLTKHTQDGVGMVDHAASGTSIVHQQTSKTYSPSPRYTLGTVSWRRYIPQDWERWLPAGWEQWDVRVPAYVHHSTNLPGNDVVSPPEQVLNPNIQVGSCWPMAGSNGQVTIRLAKPVDVKGITLDHASSLVLPSDDSAPKRVKVMGYPPCQDCNGLGFDLDQPFELVSFEYKVGTSSIQTFEVATGDDSQCSTSTASCSAPPNLLEESNSSQSNVVGGVSFQVLDNWGSAFYTCIYRIRIHGDVTE